MSKDESQIEFGSFRLNPAERSLVSAAGAPVQLTRKLYDTLLFMVERPGRLLEKQALLDAVWKGAVVEENTLSRTVSALRQILGERAGEHRYIETVSGLGYRFIQQVTVTAARAPQAQVRRHEPSLAVLPFEDLSREHDQGYFADGIAEEVLNRLAGVKGLRLIAKSSSFRFRDRVEGAREIGRKLGVDYLLVGAVRKDGEHLRVTSQLIDVASDSQLWSERFDRELELGHIFAVQDDIARAVANAFRATLGVTEALLVEGSTRDLDAYDLYLRANSLTGQLGAYGVVRAAEMYREVVTRDPDFAAAWFSFAGSSRGRIIFAPEHAASALQDIYEAVARLQEIAPQWWATHLARSWILHLKRDWLETERALHRARDLAPGMPAQVVASLGTFCAQVNDSRGALEHFRASTRSDPLSLLASALLQKELHHLGRDDEAEVEYRRSLDLVGDREMAEHMAIHRLWARGAPFREQLRRYLDLTQTKPAPVLEVVYTVCDEPRLALQKLRAAAAAPEYQNPTRQLVLSWWLAHYGDVDAAFAATWRGFVDMGHFLVDWLRHPVLARVREHARYPELLERVGLADYWRAKNQTPPQVPRIERKEDTR